MMLYSSFMGGESIQEVPLDYFLLLVPIPLYPIQKYRVTESRAVSLSFLGSYPHPFYPSYYIFNAIDVICIVASKSWVLFSLYEKKSIYVKKILWCWLLKSKIHWVALFLHKYLLEIFILSFLLFLNVVKSLLQNC